jgi:hypothetical protein
MPTCPLCHGEIGHISNPLDHLKVCPAVDANRHNDKSAAPFLEATNPAENGMANSQGDFTFGYIMGGVYALGAVWSLVYGMHVGSEAPKDVMIALLVFLVAHITASVTLARAEVAVGWNWLMTSLFALGFLAHGIDLIQIGLVSLMTVHSYWLQRSPHLLTRASLKELLEH